MSLTLHEKIVLVVLSAALLLGATILYGRYSRPFHKITILENGISEQITLEEVEERLKENRKVDINTSGIEELISVPGVGEVLAARIIAYRNTHGIYYSESDLLGVEGIGRKKLERIREYVKIE